MSVTIAIRNNETGETETAMVGDGDYLIVTTAPAYVAHTTAHGNGTHVIAVKGRDPERLSRSGGYERGTRPRAEQR